MNLALFFEGTGQGVHGKKTNVSLACEACVEDAEQRLHLESGPGTNFGYFLSGAAAGHDWRKIFASARRWFEGNCKVKAKGEDEGRTGDSALRLQTSTSTRVFLFGFSRGALLARHFAAWLDKLSVEVEYMGLWDTVDATPGLEVSEVCPPNVKCARHAVAEHEARRFFAYVPLKGRTSSDLHRHLSPSPAVPLPVVEELLFPGVHSDVGGLYEDNHELADIARAWVMEPAVARGLRLRPGLEFRIPVPSDQAIRHDSLRLPSNLFGLLRPLRRSFPVGMKRQQPVSLARDGQNQPIAKRYGEE